MPWDKQDYPSSLKNLEAPIRNKAIDIANAMVDEGYDEGRAIPIATEQAKEWYNNASEAEIEDIEGISNQDLRSRGEDATSSRPELLDKGEHVIPHNDGWAVQAQDAKQPSNVYDNKKDAINRAREIAENKGTSVTIHQKDGSVQDRMDK